MCRVTIRVLIKKVQATCGCRVQSGALAVELSWKCPVEPGTAPVTENRVFGGGGGGGVTCCDVVVFLLSLPQYRFSHLREEVYTPEY